MACSLINSIPFACRDSVGGIKEIKIKTYPGLSAISQDFVATSGVVAITGNSLDTWYAYYVEKETASMTDAANNSVQNGTSFMQTDLQEFGYTMEWTRHYNTQKKITAFLYPINKETFHN